MTNRNVKVIIDGQDCSGRLFDARMDRVLRVANDMISGPGNDIGFLLGTACQISLPTTGLSKEIRVWECSNGGASVQIEAGSAYDPDKEQWQKLSLPYGSRARLALIHLSTEAVRQQSPVIKPNRSMTSFLKRVLNRNPNGHDISEFKNQMSALGAATIRLGTRERQTQSHIVSGFDLMWQKRERARVLWPSEFVLSNEYWSSLQSQAVPIDLKALTAISHSSIAMDIYLWLTERLHRVQQPYTVYWQVLWKQFGQGYKRLRDFRRKFLHALYSVKKVYPNALIDEAFNDNGISKGVRIKRSPPPIPYNIK